jgi:membrane-bound lytic murein transglycosylase D
LKYLTRTLALSLALNVANCSSIHPLSNSRKVEVDHSSPEFSAVEFDYKTNLLMTKVGRKPNKKYNHLKKYFKDEKKVKKEDKKVDLIPQTEIIKINKETPVKIVNSKKNDIDGFKLEYNQKLYDFWIKYFTKLDRERFIRHLNNGAKYRQLVMNIFKEQGLPKELYYVGLIESGYNSRVKSRAKATGYWQFMKGTAKNYGLKINRSVDERTNIHKSTLAAAQYLKDLYNIFGSWELALCAYNKGEYGIIKAIRKGKTRNYNELVQKKLLPKETAYYIPKLMAARHLSRNKKILKVRNEQIQNEDKDFTRSKIYSLFGQTTLKKISRDLGLRYSDIKKLNPDYNYTSLRGTRRNPLRVILPKLNGGVALNIKNVKVSRITASSRHRFVKPGKKKTYRVRRGDNLTHIARKFGVSLRDLKYVNSLNRKGKIYIGQRIKIPKLMGNFYVVRKGDNLTFIARKFKTSISKLLNLNGLKSGKIYPRQRILVPSKG